MNHPFLVEQQVRDRQEELRMLAQVSWTDGGEAVHRWRRAAGRALVTLGVFVGLPRERRRPAVADAVALLERRTATEPARAPAC